MVFQSHRWWSPGFSGRSCSHNLHERRSRQLSHRHRQQDLRVWERERPCRASFAIYWQTDQLPCRRWWSRLLWWCLRWNRSYEDGDGTAGHREWMVCILTLLMLEMEYSGLVGSVPYLLIPWLLKSPEHQQAWYWLCRTDNMYCCRVNCIYLGQAKSKIWFKWEYIFYNV